MSSKSPIKQHYFLLAATCITIDAADREAAKSPDNVVGVSRIPVQVLLVQPNREFTANSIAKGQMGAQQSLYRVVHKDKVDVVDVIIDSIMHLGFMTPEQFNGPKSPEQLVQEAIAVAKAAGVEVSNAKAPIAGESAPGCDSLE